MTVEVAAEETGDAALRYAWHGWPILPGAQPAKPRPGQWPAPLDAALPHRNPMGTNDVVRSWHSQPHPVLLATGLTIDVFEMPRSQGPELLQQLEPHGPVAVLPGGRWLFFVEAGPAPSDELLLRTVRYHGAGGWVPLPPTRIGHRPVTWHIDPASVRWRLFRRGRIDGALRPSPPPRRPPKHSPALSGQPLPNHQHAPQPQAPSREPQPRHHVLLIASGNARFAVTHAHQEPT